MKHNEKKYSILIVDDEKQNLETLAEILNHDYNIYTVRNGYSALKIAKKYIPDLILLDILMPDMDGYQVFEKLRIDNLLCNIPVIFVTALGSTESEEKGLALGAADYITKPFNSTIVKLRVRNQIKIINQIETIKQLSTVDQLTRIPNRRSFDYRISIEWDRAKRENAPISILLLDIDNFKQYNDTYGHLQGDTALQEIARIFEQSLRRSIDFVARWGGEEFVALLPDTDSEGALIVAESIRKKIEGILIPCQNGKGSKITVSIGVNTCIPGKDNTSTELFIGADKALYKVKKSGKNNVRYYKN